MPRKPQELWQHRFNLTDDGADEKRLHEHLVKLAETGQASDWIIATLMAAVDVPVTTQVVPAKYTPSTPEVHAEYTPDTSRVHPKNPPPSKTTSSVLPKPTNGTPSPTDLLSERRRLAAEKHPPIPPRGKVE